MNEIVQVGAKRKWQIFIHITIAIRFWHVKF
jgi:hypothetical protein